jgi:hypothetical protein
MEGPLVHLGQTFFSGPAVAEKKSRICVRPTQERFSKTQALLPFVSMVEEGADWCGVLRFRRFIDLHRKAGLHYVRPIC